MEGNGWSSRDFGAVDGGQAMLASTQPPSCCVYLPPTVTIINAIINQTTSPPSCRQKAEKILTSSTRRDSHKAGFVTDHKAWAKSTRCNISNDTPGKYGIPPGPPSELYTRNLISSRTDGHGNPPPNRKQYQHHLQIHYSSYLPVVHPTYPDCHQRRVARPCHRSTDEVARTTTRTSFTAQSGCNKMDSDVHEAVPQTG